MKFKKDELVMRKQGNKVYTVDKELPSGLIRVWYLDKKTFKLKKTYLEKTNLIKIVTRELGCAFSMP